MSEGGTPPVLHQFEQQVDAVVGLATAIHRLREMGVIRSRRFIGDLGEWYIATLYNGVQPSSQTQKGWDIQLPTGDRLQVKTVSFDKGNLWSYVNADPATFDRYLFLVLSDAFVIKFLYDIPSPQLPSAWRIGKEGKPLFYFKDVERWRVDVASLPGYEKVAQLVEKANG